MSEVWTNMASPWAYGKSDISVTTWAAETEYSLDDYVTPTVPNDRIYKCVTAGTSGETEPTWTLTMGGTVTDGEVTWYCTNTFSLNPFTVALDTGGFGGLPRVEVWIKSDVTVTFDVYGSKNGEGWRWTDELKLPYAGRTDIHQGYHNAYRHIKVVTITSGVHEIEIVAGA